MEAARAVPERVIEPAKGWSFPDLRELWVNRDLLYFMARRDVAIRYRQAAVGTFWAILQPLLIAGVFSVFFGILAKVPSEEGIPYPMFALAGMVMWLFFANGMTACALSTVQASTLISKVYFPRLLIPVAAVAPAVVDFSFGFVVVVVVAALYGFEPQIQLVLFPALVGLTLVTILGIGLWLAALNVKYRDVVLVVPFITLVGLFITPVIYPFNLVPENLQPLYAVNPMAGLLELYRWMILPTDWPGPLLLISVGVSALMLVSGALYFKRAEQSFADVI
jgi:lipopolysaccharide transport system permease protein